MVLNLVVTLHSLSITWWWVRTASLAVITSLLWVAAHVPRSVGALGDHWSIDRLV